MIVGTLGAAGNGAAWPIFAVLFSKFTDAFGGTSPNFMDQVGSGHMHGGQAAVSVAWQQA